MAELAGIVYRRTESYAVPLCGGLFRGQRTTYGVNWHGVLDLAGMIPGVGPYAWEDDWLGACQSLWSTLPGIKDAFQGSKIATGVSKFASRGDDVAGVAKFGRGSKAKEAARSSGPVFKRDGEA